MRSVSIRELQHHLSDVIQKVDHGQEFQITQRKRVVARLVPERVGRHPIIWPDFAKRARGVLRAKGKSLSSHVLEDRNERC